MNIFVPLDNETYQEYINRIQLNRKNVKDKKHYQEKHHIIPKCMNGSNDEENLIYLYPQEHYYAHSLLAQENPENIPLNQAWFLMAHENKELEISAEEYATMKSNYSEAQSKFFSGVNNPMYGRTGEKNPAYGWHRYGELNPFYGRNHSDETKKKISRSNKGKLAGDKNPSAKMVRCVNTGEIFSTVQEAAKWSNTSKWGSNIIKCCKGLLQFCGKHPETGEKLQWEYVNKE